MTQYYRSVFLSIALSLVTHNALSAIDTEPETTQPTPAVSLQNKQQVGGYVGGSIGALLYNLDSKNSSAGPFDSSALAISPYGGYNFNEWLGIEAMVTFASGYSASLYPTTRQSNLVIFSAAPKFTWQMTDIFALYGKIGLNVTGFSNETRFYFVDETTSWAGVGISAGLGLQLAMTPEWIWRLGYEFNQAHLYADDSVKYTVNQEFIKIQDLSTQNHTVNLGIHYQF
ncbi:Uncharacterised protein [BD1-7 clade bacterium]|uniref:Outer membrane protein beta-barrel domain-containing protein n=1 Tax=BD1-7 clade bacterium TaxID=2029982 RepID=A0A5S9QZF2_9GAMM|nr:Uncharacterised protein [BD1-7 clade bacterium]